MFCPFCCSGPPKSETDELAPRKKKTRTQLRRERKKRQKERERRQREFLKVRDEAEKSSTTAQNEPTDLPNATGVKSLETAMSKTPSDSSSESIHNSPKTDLYPPPLEQRKKKKKKKVEKARRLEQCAYAVSAMCIRSRQYAST